MSLMAMVLAMLVGPPAAAAQELTLLGSFDNVRSSSSEEPHCYGYSMTLWADGSGLLGLFDVHEGLCGDPPCATLQNISFERRTGRLSFSATIGSKLEFSGTLRRDDVIGRLNGKRIRLARRRDHPHTPTSLVEWCAFWRSVPRCAGVADFCTARGLQSGTAPRARVAGR